VDFSRVDVPQSYQLRTLVSQNDFCESWVATKGADGQECFLKVASPTSSIPLAAISAAFQESFGCQRILRSSTILRARAFLNHNGTGILEYPVLDRNRWQELTSAILVSRFQVIFPAVCLAVDYLHALDLVHCDLKLANFLVSEGDRNPPVIVCDLDLLRKNGSRPDSTVLGTPAHISPEILSNSKIWIQSDNFSLGMSLKRWLQELGPVDESLHSLDATTRNRLAEAIEPLLESDYLKRPGYLLAYFRDRGIIDDSIFRQCQRQLFSMVIATRLSAGDRSSFGNGSALEDFIVEKCKIFGLEQELVEDIAAAFSVSRRRTFQAVRGAFGKSALERHADYWHVLLPDAALTRLYNDLEAITVSGGKPSGISPHPLAEDLLAKAQQYRLKGHISKAFLAYKRLLDLDTFQGDGHSAEERYRVLLEAGELAGSLSRAQDARLLLESAIDYGRSSGIDTSDAVIELVTTLGRIFDFASCNHILERELARKDIDLRSIYGLKLRRSKAFLLIFGGELDTARSELDALQIDAEAQEAHEVVCLTLYTIGVLHRERRDRSAAIKALKEAYSVAEVHALPLRAISIQCVLCSIYSELGMYDLAVAIAKIAIRMMAEHKRMLSASMPCQILVLDLVKLAEFSKARYWLQRLYRLSSQACSSENTAAYLYTAGYVWMHEGDTEGARKALLDAAQMTKGHRQLAWVYMRLTDLSLYTGELSSAEENVAKALEHSEKGKGLDWSLEGRLAQLLIDADNSTPADTDALLKVVEQLLQIGSLHVATAGLLRALLLKDEASTEIAKIADPYIQSLLKSQSPRLHATGLLLLAAGTPSDQKERLESWKAAFSVLHRGHQRYWAMLVGLKLSSLYEAAGQIRHAKNFVQQSLDLARALGNKRYVLTCESSIQRLSEAFDNSSRMTQALLGISTMIRDMTNFQESLNRLLQFAVDHTGAERAVIMLQKRDSSDLQVIASLNCDDESLKDVTDFSSNLPRDAINTLLPVVIENARADRRTKKYRSVVYHNILSVVCVPLIDGANPIGVLYLDHHTIPSVFDPDDLQYVLSIANFLTVILTTAKQFRTLSSTNLQLIQDLNRFGNPASFITRDPSLLRLFDHLPQIARTNASVLLSGESGTGKELLCRMIHDLSNRAKEPLIKVNCAAIAPTLIESELFGVAKNTATGVGEREGKFSAADGGTLYLDEVGDMSVSMQAKVLRVLEYQQFEKVGSNRPIHTDIRFIYATNKNLLQMIREKTFREDLYYRINRIVIDIAPLRERPDDVEALIEHYLRIFSLSTKPPQFTSDALSILTRYDWPGNAREVRNLVERYCILRPGEQINASDLPAEMLLSANASPATKGAAVAAEAARIRAALARANGNQSLASAQLGMPLSTLRRKMKKYGIQPDF